MDERRQWHRWFGLCWTDFFTGLPVTVEMEKDLSVKKQLLDVVIVRKGSEPLARRPPDGFEDLSAHNLISFKSFREPLDAWALKELVGHSVNYCKLISPDQDHLVPEDQFRLYAVCVRYPEKLARRCTLTELAGGVYDVGYFGSTLRLIVTNELAQSEHNAMLHLFSYQQERLDYGSRHYKPYCPDTTSFLDRLFARYAQEGFIVPYTYEEGVRDARREIASEMPMEELLALIPVEKRLEGVPTERRLEGLSNEELLRALSPQRQEELRKLLQAGPPAAPPESKPADPG